MEKGTLALKTGRTVRQVPYVVERLSGPRARRLRYSLDVRASGANSAHVVFLAPPKIPLTDLEAFGHKHTRWITNRLAEIAQKTAARAEHTGDNICQLPTAWWQAAARRVLLPRVAWWVAISGHQPARVEITATKSRWGSCDRARVVRLSCWLLMVPPHLRDYVIVHELAHLKHMHHRPSFWKELEKTMPDYLPRRKELAKLGRLVL